MLMRGWFGLAMMALTVMIAAPASAEAPVSPAGVWRTISDTDGKPRALVRIDLNGDRARGVVIGSLRAGEDPARVCDRCKGALKNRPIIGMEILSGLSRNPNDPFEFFGGTVLDPDNGAVYRARFKLNPDGRTLVLRGFIGHPTLGRSQTWTRQSAN